MQKIFLLNCLLIITSACKQLKVGYMLSLTIETTSDWTSIEFIKNKPICLEFNIRSLKNDKFNCRPFKITKQPYDSSLVIADHLLFIPEDRNIRDTIIIRKGDIGYTKVWIKAIKGSTGLFLLNDKNIPGDSRNLMKFIISYKNFEKVNIEEYLQSHPASVTPLVFAFYYPWYKTWFRFNKQITLHTPKIGFYNSADTTVIKSHIQFAKYAGIDCFIISWFGIESFTDSVAQIMIPLLEKNQMKFVIYLEKCDSLAQFIKIKRYLSQHFFHSSAYLHFENKPVLFIYSRVPKKLRNELIPLVAADDLFIINYGSDYIELNRTDGIHIYRPTLAINELDSINQLSSLLAHYHKKVFVATVYPGFDNRPSRFPGVKGKFVDREGGRLYRKTWESALRSNADWIAIISFNEWGEATEIEPSVELDNQYLKITKEYSIKFKRRGGGFRSRL